MKKVESNKSVFRKQADLITKEEAIKGDLSWSDYYLLFRYSGKFCGFVLFVLISAGYVSFLLFVSYFMGLWADQEFEI
jgi:hypothetical protein